MTPEQLVEQKAIKDQAHDIAKGAVMLTAQGNCQGAREVIEDAATDPAVFGEIIHCLLHGIATTSQELVAAEVAIKVLQGADDE